MANVGHGIARTLIDSEGDAVLVSSTGRLAVETEQDDPFGTFVTYQAFEVLQTSQNLRNADHANDNVVDAKEIVIQTDDGNTSYVMVGSSGLTTIADATPANRKGIKLNGGETLILAVASFSAIFIDAETSGQIVSVAYFK